MRGPASGETAARQRRAFDGAKRTTAENRPDAKNEPALAQRRPTALYVLYLSFNRERTYFSLNEK